MHVRKRILTTAAAAAILLSAVEASAATDPRGLWIDHTGRGAVEITDCGSVLCGRVVWLKDAENAQACGVQILGDVKPAGAGVWDRGWIYDPEQDAKFSVELKPVGRDQLRVMGYLGTKLFSETMMWTRAPADLQRCDTGGTTAALTSPKAETPAAPSARETLKPPVENPSASREAPDNSPAEEGKSAAAGTSPGQSQEPPAASQAEPQQDEPARSSTRPQECTVRTPWLSFSFPCPE